VRESRREGERKRWGGYVSVCVCVCISIGTGKREREGRKEEQGEV
jgi:hypothetical protein